MCGAGLGVNLKSPFMAKMILCFGVGGPVMIPNVCGGVTK